MLKNQDVRLYSSEFIGRISGVGSIRAYWRMTMNKMIKLAAMTLGCLLVADPALCQEAIARKIVAAAAGAPAAGSSVSLPYTVNDNSGNSYYFYSNGMFRQQGNMPVFSQAAMIQIGGASLPSPANTPAKLDEKTGEFIIENLQLRNVNITRRILVNKNENYIRYVDIFKGTGAGETQLNLQFYTSMNYGVQTSVNVDDPKRKNQTLAWVAQTTANNQSCLEMFAGKGAKWAPTIQYNPGNSQVYYNANITIPAGKEVGIMHIHMMTSSLDAGKKWVLDVKESKLMASIPANIRRLILNFTGGQNYIGDAEVLRGDALDVVELKGGDVMKGTLKDTSFKFQTFYGPVELKASSLIGIINTVDIKPRQLFVTENGEIFGGQMDSAGITLQLSSGQTTQVPLSQISRVGYRKRDNEPDEWKFDNGLVLLRTGERIAAQPPATPLNVTTRYGAMKLNPDAINHIVFQSEEHGVHEIHLSDGSVLSGLVGDESFEMKLPGQTVKFPASSVIRLQYAKPLEEADPNNPVLSMANADTIIGMIDGALKLDTAFNTLDIQGSEIKRMTKLPNSPAGVQVVLWDDTTISGLLQDQTLNMKLNCGLIIKAPVAMMAQYVQPRPQASATVVDNIKKLVAQLNSDDWKLREKAQEELTQMGVVVLPTLNQIRAAQPPEAQQRIDQIIKDIEKSAQASPTSMMPRPVQPEATAWHDLLVGNSVFDGEIIRD